MIDGNFAVQIDNVVTSRLTADSTKGYTVVDGKGIFKWKVKESTDHTDYVEGILKEKWATGFNKGFDARRWGGVASVGGGNLDVDNTSAFYIWLTNNNVNLIGSRIVLKELITGGGERSLFHGSISGISHNDNSIIIGYEDPGKTRNAKLASQINSESNAIYPVVFGQSEKTKFVNTINVHEEVVFNSQLVLWRMEHQDPQAGYIGVRFDLKPSVETLDPNDTKAQLQALATDDILYIKCVAGNGSESIRKVESIGAVTSDPLVAMEVRLSESEAVNYGTPEWIEAGDISYLKFFSVKSISHTDIWENCKEFQNQQLYTTDDNNYILISNNGDFVKDGSEIAFKPTNLIDFGKVAGWSIENYTDVKYGTDAVAQPSDIGISGTWYYDSSAGCWADDNTQPAGSITGNIASVSDNDFLTEIVFKVGVDNYNGAHQLQVLKLSGLDHSGDELELLLSSIFREDKTGSFSAAGGTIDVIAKNAFGSEVLVSFDILWPGSGVTTFRTEIHNFPEGFLKNDTSHYSFYESLNHNRSWWEEADGVEDSGAALGYGMEKLKLALSNATSGISEIYLAVDTYTAGAGGASISEQYYRQIQLAKKMPDIDVTKGLYAKWWGREFSSTDFGSGETDLMRKSNDVLNHVCRLQNFEQAGKLAPVEGWGLKYIADYTDIINNTASYGGLQYAGFNNVYIDAQRLTIQEASSKNLKDKICKEAWLLSAVNSEGKESMFPMEKAFDETMPRTTIDFFNIIDKKITISDRMASDIFCTPYAQYNKNYSNGKYSSNITISNVEQTVYNSSYVTGVTNSSDATRLWNKARSLYLRYGVINLVPETMTKLDLIKEEAGAIQYLDNWLDWQGGSESGYNDRRVLNFKLPYEYAIDNSFDFGKLVTVELPFIDDTKVMNGVVTDIRCRPDTKNPTYNITVYAELKSLLVGNGALLQESGAYILQESSSLILL